MQYVKIHMGMDSDEKEDIKYKEYFDSHIDQIANKELAIENGYFFGVEEAKIVLEGSMVIRGSNDATPIRQKEIEAALSTSNQPSNDTEKGMVICPSCQTRFDRQKEPEVSMGSVKCPGCGQFVSSSATSIEVPLFDLMKAIKETTFIKN